MHYIIGIDEAGRGPWAGPVSAGVFAVPVDFDFSYFPWLTDSKKLTHAKREMLFTQIEKLEKEGKCVFAYAESSAWLIDQVGIREANRLAMEQSVLQVLETIRKTEHGLPRRSSTETGKSPRNDENGPQGTLQILIDWRDNYTFDWIPREKVRFIVRGDITEPVISAASIVAKVKRDRIMCDFSREYPLYGFDQHKGYGTLRHRAALMNYGITPIHRKSYAPVKALISREA
jgi:ribonuclease HII